MRGGKSHSRWQKGELGTPLGATAVHSTCNVPAPSSPMVATDARGVE